ncbi:MAG: CapA family protein [Anaerolineaceae bacterium]|nr:CapA family protein [Anaerolineaceae bacterium]
MIQLFQAGSLIGMTRRRRYFQEMSVGFRRIRIRTWFHILLAAVIVAGCSNPGALGAATATSEIVATPSAQISATIQPTSTPTPVWEKDTVWFSRSVPAEITEKLLSSADWRVVENPQRAAYRVEMLTTSEPPPDTIQVIEWVYALVAPFPTVPDGLTLLELRRAWNGGELETFGRKPILMDEDTRRVMEVILGSPANTGVQVIERDGLLRSAWEQRPALAIVPFDELEARWKTLRVDGVSPLEREFEPAAYPLAARWAVRAVRADEPAGKLSSVTNRDPERMTILTLTGTTALARRLALRMEEEGILYPAEDIRPWLLEADLLHVSSEVPFYAACPPAKPLRAGMRFCSDPKYIELLTSIGTDVVELTGNHIFDWGAEAFLFTLDLYRQHGILTYGGGRNKEEARRPLLLTHNGNRIALLGCNDIGPANILAAYDQPGAAPCDLDWLESQIAALRSQGYQVVVTFQSLEAEQYPPHSAQRGHFKRMAQAGAVIVSGSQAHYPQTFSFESSNLIHFGLGNLFFDQMSEGNRRAFIDRHVFYDGRYLGVELLTTMLEDHAKPRPMTPAERAALLEAVFAVGEW